MVYTRMIYMTANIGSITHEREAVLLDWVDEIAKEVGEQKAEFVAIALTNDSAKEGQAQEFKIKDLARSLRETKILQEYEICLGFTDESNKNTNDYVGLTSLFFLKDESTAKIWNTKKQEFTRLRGTFEFHDMNSEYDQHVIRVPFTQKQMTAPDTDSYGKGFTRTRFMLHGTALNFVAVQLPGDASNLPAVEKFPSIYAEQRTDLLETVFQRLEPDFANEPVFIGGNYNTRIDLEGFMEGMGHVKRSEPKEGENGDDDKTDKIDYVSMNGKVATIKDDSVDFFADHDWMFSTCKGRLVKKHDRELQVFNNVLFEASITFPPTFPYNSGYLKLIDETDRKFLRSACPSWTDRVAMNAPAWQLVKSNSFSSSSVFYNMVGEKFDMGVHKPVYLSANVNITTEDSNILNGN